MDDIVFGLMSQRMVEQFVEHMSIEFEMSLVGEMTYFLGLQVRKTDSKIFISQDKYSKNLVSKFRLDTTKQRRTLVGTHEKITRDETSNEVDQTLYRSMIGSLLCVTASRWDLYATVWEFV